MYDEHDKPELAAELAALEKQLANLAPATPCIDRDRLMYNAGEAAAIARTQPGRLGYIAEPSRLGRGFWQSTTAIATAASIALAAMLISQRDDSQIASATSGTAIAGATQATHSDDHDLQRPEQLPPGYLGMRYMALTQGVGALSSDSPSPNGDLHEAASPTTPRELLKELLPASDHSSS